MQFIITVLRTNTAMFVFVDHMWIVKTKFSTYPQFVITVYWKFISVKCGYISAIEFRCCDYTQFSQRTPKSIPTIGDIQIISIIEDV